MARALPLALLGLLLVAGCGGSDSDEAATATQASSTTTAESTTAAEAAPAAESAQDVQRPGAEEIEIGRPVSIRNTLEAVLSGSTDAALICDALVTENYVRTAYGAREGCIAAQKPGALADSAEIVEVERAGDAASAVAIPAGGPYDGVEVEVELVRDGGAWQVDSLLADVPAGP